MAPTMPKIMKALLDSPDFGEPQILSCNAAPLRRVAGGLIDSQEYFCECAGRGFFERYEQAAPAHQEEEDDTGSDSDAEAGQESAKREKSKGQAVLKVSELLKGVNLYKLLGVSEGASQDDIKKAYRQRALESHPDKIVGKSEKEAQAIQENFIKIQEGYEILSDPAKRQLYDSSMDFDDSLPKFKPEGKMDFFEVFGEAFTRNGRFSVRRPVPEIGTLDTPVKEWKRFYDFWNSFQSWRDPLAMAQQNDEELCDLEEAECREEKRWMMRENARVAKKYKAAEQARVASLVAMAEKFDPRILAEKEAKKAARAAEAQRREEERTAVQREKAAAEQRRLEAEAAAQAAEAERRREEKALREAAKMEVKKCRQRLRAFHPRVKDLVMLDQVNDVCLQLEEPALRSLGDEVEAALSKSVEAAAATFYAAIASIGLKAVVPEPEKDDTDSTVSGPPDSNPEEEEPVLTAEQQRAKDEAQKKEAQRRADAQAKQRELDAAQQAERERASAQAAEEKKKREEQRRKELMLQDAKRKQQEKKEKEKAQKAAEKKLRDEEAEAQRREAQREEDRLRKEAQASHDREAAQLESAERLAERITKLFDDDRCERLAALDLLSDVELRATLDAAVAADQSLHASFLFLELVSLDMGEDQMLDRALALVNDFSPVWNLGLPPPADVQLPSHTRARVKKARTLLRTQMGSFLKSLKPLPKATDAAVAATIEPAAAEAGGSPSKKKKGKAKSQEVPAQDYESLLTELQRGIVDGKLEIPVWSAAQREAELKAVEAAKMADTPSPAKKGKKGKGESPKEEEDLDSLLAEFGVEIKEKKKKNKK